MSLPQREDIAGSDIYRLIARHSLRELHDNLMISLYRFFMERSGKHTLVVAGQGPEVVPFSRNLDLVQMMIGPGNIAMFDYNQSIIATSVDALINPRFENDEVTEEGNRNGVIKKGYSFLDVDPNVSINLREIGIKKIIIRYGDLLNHFMFDDSSVSAFDATLAIHHATAYTQGLEHVIREVHRILEPGGLFHWGTGNVNMRYQEEKIHRVATSLQQFYNAQVALEDRRDPTTNQENIVSTAFYPKTPESDRIPLVDESTYHIIIKKSNNPVMMQLTKEGGISIQLSEGRKAEKFKQYLLDKGFKQVHVLGENQILLPIIDPEMTEDQNNFLLSVRNYYGGIISLNQEVFSDKPEVRKIVNAADNKEFYDASRGLYEYYTDHKIIQEMLVDNGFDNLTYIPDSRNIWCSITAYKAV